MSYSDLALNRDKIPDSLKRFHPDAKVFGPEKKTADFHIYTIRVPGQTEAKLNVYFTKKGGTTLSINTGKNQELSDQIAAHVKKECEVAAVSEKNLYVAKMSDEEYSSLCEFLKDFGVTFEESKNLNHGKQIKVIEPYGGHLLFNRYSNGSFQVQGRNRILKSWVIEGLTELLPFKDVIEMQLESIDAEITPDQAISGLKQVLPTAYDFLGDTLVTIITPSIALSTVNIELSDYSSFAFAALRGLEGYIKKLFKERGIIVTGNNFGTYIDGGTGGARAFLLPAAKGQINSPKFCKAIEDSYNYFRNHRHGLFHVDGIIETTRIISTKREADELLKDIFNVIETTYVNLTS